MSKRSKKSIRKEKDSLTGYPQTVDKAQASKLQSLGFSHAYEN